MIKAPGSLQDLRRRIYRKAKSDQTHRFWGLFVHVAKLDTLAEAYQQAKRNAGAPGLDGQTFADIEAAGLDQFLEAMRDELLAGTYQPRANSAKGRRPSTGPEKRSAPRAGPRRGGA